MSERAALTAAMERLKDGDRSAFEPVYVALHPLVLRFATRLLSGERAAAEDVTQEALAKLFKNAWRYRSGTDPVSWALALTAWEVRTVKRRRSRRREVCLEPVNEPTHAPQVHGELNAREQLQAAEYALGSLSDDERATLSAAIDQSAPLSAKLRKRKQRAIEKWRARFSKAYAPGDL